MPSAPQQTHPPDPLTDRCSSYCTDCGHCACRRDARGICTFGMQGVDGYRECGCSAFRAASDRVDGPACLQPYLAEAAEAVHGRIAPRRPPGDYGKGQVSGPPVTERTEVEYHDVYGNLHTLVLEP